MFRRKTILKVWFSLSGGMPRTSTTQLYGMNSKVRPLYGTAYCTPPYSEMSSYSGCVNVYRSTRTFMYLPGALLTNDFLSRHDSKMLADFSSISMPCTRCCTPILELLLWLSRKGLSIQHDLTLNVVSVLLLRSRHLCRLSRHRLSAWGLTKRLR